MKNIFKSLVIILAAALLLAGCGKKASSQKEEPSAETEKFLVQVNVEGIGEIAATDDGSDPAFDDQYPFTSFVSMMEKGGTLKVSVRTNEPGWTFVKWTKNGEYFGAESELEVKVTEAAEYIAHFYPVTGYEGKAVEKIEDAKTFADVLALPYREIGYDEDKYVFVFELNGVTYRAETAMTEELLNSLRAIEWDDPEHDKKEMEVVAPLAITKLDNLNALIPSDEHMSKFIGKNAQELVDAGWGCSDVNFEDKVLTMNYGMFEYEVSFEGEVKDPSSFNMDTDLKLLTAKGFKFSRIGGAMDFIVPEE